MTTEPTTPADIIDFWFAPENRDFWFRSTPEMDAWLKQRFEKTWHAASTGLLDDWRETPEGCLALAIVLDQFPLNMFRGRPESFATESRAIDVTRHAIDNGFDEKLPPQHRVFLYMPLMHSENLADQDLSVALFEAAGLEDNLRFARHHRELIRRFGRFPYRNAILGRDSSKSEQEYLASKEAFSG